MVIVKLQPWTVDATADLIPTYREQGYVIACDLFSRAPIRITCRRCLEPSPQAALSHHSRCVMLSDVCGGVLR